MLARQGFSESDLILNWDDIVGERLAANSRPIKLQWPARPAKRIDTPMQPATLVIRVEGGFALDMQHMSEQVLARVNGHLGWRCVGRLSFKQGPIERAEPVARRGRAPSADRVRAVGRRLDGIGDDGLKAALSRLGAHILK